MKEILLFILISVVYILSLLAMYHFFNKKNDKSKNKTDQVLTEISGKINIIAMPRNYIINLVQDDKQIDTTQFADLVVNISDYIRTKEEKENPNEPNLKKIFLKDINFAQLKKIN